MLSTRYTTTTRKRRQKKNKIQNCINVTILDYFNLCKLDFFLSVFALTLWSLRNLQRWIEDFLSARSQGVVIDDTKSTPSPVPSGVPQSSVLGPLFLACINDMPASVWSTIKLFAEDSLFYRKLTNPRDCACSNQQDTDWLQEWEKKWQMAFNADKQGCNNILKYANIGIQPLTICCIILEAPGLLSCNTGL